MAAALVNSLPRALSIDAAASCIVSCVMPSLRSPFITWFGVYVASTSAMASRAANPLDAARDMCEVSQCARESRANCSSATCGAGAGVPSIPDGGNSRRRSAATFAGAVGAVLCGEGCDTPVVREASRALLLLMG